MAYQGGNGPCGNADCGAIYSIKPYVADDEILYPLQNYSDGIGGVEVVYDKPHRNCMAVSKAADRATVQVFAALCFR